MQMDENSIRCFSEGLQIEGCALEETEEVVGEASPHAPTTPRRRALLTLNYGTPPLSAASPLKRNPERLRRRETESTITELQKQLSIEEKVKNGANNLLVAYSKSSAKSDPTMQLHATDMLSEAMSKIEFLKTEIIRQDQAAAAIGGVFEQADRALAARYTLEQRRNEVVHRMLVEALVHDGAEKLVAKGRANGKAALSAARKRAEESASKLELLMQANDVLKAVDMSSASNPIEFLVPRTSQLVSGCLTIHVVQAEGLIRDVSGRRSRFRPFVVATIGNDVTAQTSACRKPGETPKWSETLTLRFTRERECELQCFSSKGAMCGLQYLQLEDLLDGESHAVRVPLEPQGTLWLNLSFANVLVVRPPAQGLSRTREMRVKKQQGRRLARAAELGIGVAPWARLVREGGAEVPAMRTPQQPVASPRLLTVAGGSSIQYSRTSPAGGSASKPPRFELNSPDPRGSLALSPISRHVGSPPLYKGGTEAAAAGGAGSHTLQMSDFHVLRLLGKGHFGKVLLAQRKGTNQLAAVKCIRKSEVLSRDELDSMTTERNVFRAVNKGRSSFLLRLYGAFQTESHICFAMEYCPGGDLLAQIQRDGVFDGPRARFYTACVVLAMRFLHQRSIIYRDLKLDNVLIDGRGYARLADYGLCKEHVGYGGRTSTFCGTPEFLAPEVLEKDDYTLAVDWWGVGVLLYEMLVGEAPFPGDSEEEIFDAIVYTDIEYPQSLSLVSTSLMRKLLVKNPAKRLGAGPDGANDVMKHSYFAGINWTRLEAGQERAVSTPKLSKPDDTSHFDPEFTAGDTSLTPDGRPLDPASQAAFADFSFTANWFSRRETRI